MRIDKITLAYFSPTRTSRTYAKAFAAATGLPVGSCELDVTHETLSPVTLTDNDLLVIAVPVYGGHVAPLALKRLDSLHGDATPAVLLTVYGNREFGSAHRELSEFLTARGFITVAAGALIGEHSYSTAATPIAPGRPNAKDLLQTARFAKNVAKKLSLQSAPAAIDISKLKHPATPPLSILQFALFVLDYRRRNKRKPVQITAQADTSLCKNCGACVKVCPVQAIPSDDPTRTDAERCIKCAACVKCCPASARSIDTPFAPILSKYFSEAKPASFLL